MCILWVLAPAAFPFKDRYLFQLLLRQGSCVIHSAFVPPRFQRKDDRALINATNSCRLNITCLYFRGLEGASLDFYNMKHNPATTKTFLSWKQRQQHKWGFGWLNVKGWFPSRKPWILTAVLTSVTGLCCYTTVYFLTLLFPPFLDTGSGCFKWLLKAFGCWNQWRDWREIGVIFLPITSIKCRSALTRFWQQNHGPGFKIMPLSLRIISTPP